MTNDIAALDGEQSGEQSADNESADVYEIDSNGIDTEQLARDIVHVIWDLKGLNPVAIDLRGRVSYTDFIIVCTGTSDRHVRALGKTVERKMRDAGWDPISIEGVESGNWAVLDFGDVVVHVFDGFERESYDLEGMWVDADQLDFEDPPEELYGHFQAEQFE
jgi:ribosome-associated protein